MSRPLIITPGRKEAIQKFLEMAHREENWFYPGVSDWTPGDRPEYIFQFDSYRVCYTCSIIEDKPHRQISVSIPTDELPAPAAVFTIANLFGFTGGKGMGEDVITEHGEDWVIVTQPLGEGRECVMVVQKIERNQAMNEVFRKLYGPSSLN